MKRVQKIIQDLDLRPHPEGGYFRETYRSTGLIHEESLGSDFEGGRNYATGIYFLLTSDTFSAFHRINQDEMWHFYDGSPARIHIISESGEYTTAVLGLDFDNGEIPQFVVPPKHWFAVKVEDKHGFTLAGCTVAPGFDFKDFDMPNRQVLTSKFPEHRELIAKLTHE